MVILACEANCKTACLLSSKYICSTSGFKETDFKFPGMLCLFIDSTWLVVPGKTSHSSGVIELYALLNFFRTCGRLNHCDQVSTLFGLRVSTWSANIDDEFGVRYLENVSKLFASHKTSVQHFWMAHRGCISQVITRRIV